MPSAADASSAKKSLAGADLFCPIRAALIDNGQWKMDNGQWTMDKNVSALLTIKNTVIILHYVICNSALGIPPNASFHH